MRYLLLRTILTLLLVCLADHASSQDPPTKHYTIEDGLPGNTVYEAYRDSKGFLWFATDKGIARYDGISFERFSTHDGLPDNSIFFFQEDLYGRLWLATYNGQLCYFKDDTFHTAANTPFLRLPFKTPFIQFISLQEDSSVTICFEERFKFLNISKNKCTVHTLDTGISRLSDGKILHVKKKADKGFDITLNDRVISVDKNTKIVRVHERFTERRIECLVGQNKIYYYSNKSIFSEQKEVVYRFKHHFYTDYTLSRVYSDGTNLFFAGHNGLVVNDSLYILKGEKVSSITQDDLGNYYISTLGNGIYVLSAHFFSTAVIKKAYRNNVVFTCLKKNKIFFATTDNELFTLDGHKPERVLEYGRYDRKHIGAFAEPGILLDDDLRYYVFFLGNMLVANNVSANRPLIQVRYDTSRAPKPGIKYVASNKRYIYLGSRKGIQRYDRTTRPDTGKVFEFITNPDGERIFGMASNVDGSIWYTSATNTYKITHDHAVLQPQFRDITLRSIMFFDSCMIGNTQQDELLICSNVNGKVHVDTIPYSDCVWNKIYKINNYTALISSNNIYWLLTLYPDKATKKYTLAPIEDPFIPLHAETICAGPDNCYFFKNGDITYIETRDLLVKQKPPKLFFRYLRTRKHIYPFAKEIVIPYRRSKNITISFKTLSPGSRSVHYQYSISRDSFDNWRDLTGELNLADPGAGTYIVKIRACTASSEYSEPMTFTLVIRKPWWATWWALTLLIVACTCTIYIFMRIRVTNALLKKEQQHHSEMRFLRSEYKALNALMNPHFIFNTLNNVQALVNRNDKLAANEYLRVFADLVRQNMQNVAQEMIPLEKEMDLVSNYLRLEKLRFEDDLTYSIYIEDDIDLSDIMIPPLLIQPLVENSIKHGIYPMRSHNGIILISLFERNEILTIEVKDNGVGMNNIQHKNRSGHASSALENIRKRIADLALIQNRRIELTISDERDDNGRSLWTIVTVTMPIA